ncbi:hypothetical protein SAMN06297144_1855 [Sphingomonas guangdongensis]|uniref:Uncharacterized protein n=1 Tax=Sphingomonas guangdongensis TaxID=1141890 RepID=A0A285QY45_9SPHN|nr:hypothetical protein [Sphingomonas guangdongensis]SOB86746.1 hypothetical protein SAMN06297144_1855 [Sphingomonas guangdongensis]
MPNDHEYAFDSYGDEESEPQDASDFDDGDAYDDADADEEDRTDLGPDGVVRCDFRDANGERCPNYLRTDEPGAGLDFNFCEEHTDHEVAR